MKGSRQLMAVAVLGFLMSVPSAGWAQMGHHGGGSHMHDGSRKHHMGMSDHREAMDEVFKNYFAIQASLANDSMEGVSIKAEALEEATEKFHHDSMKAADHGHEGNMHEIVADIGTVADSLASKKDLDSARNEFAKLSEKMVEYQRMHGKEHSPRAHAFVCDMAKKVWLQEGEEPRNPYYGSAMLRCARKLK